MAFLNFPGIQPHLCRFWMTGLGAKSTGYMVMVLLLCENHRMAWVGYPISRYALQVEGCSAKIN